MNLIRDKWIEVVRRSGFRERIAPTQLTEGADDPVVEVLAPRPDFRGALYQFLIGLLQTACAPEDLSEWKERWEDPINQPQLQRSLEPSSAAFELDGNGPAFMQDFDMPETEPIGIGGLLIDAPSENALEKNKDHFIHQGKVTGLCRSCAATALLTLQLNAPEGGVGYRVSLRGGGPLTTLQQTQDADAPLWHKLWMNVLPKDALAYPENPKLSDVFPWMAITRTSEPKCGVNTTPEVTHPLQAYWSMSWRTRLDFYNVSAGRCDLCGEGSERLVRQWRKHNYGINYTGAWMHPLTPYRYDPKGENVPLSIKGQKGGIGYRDWLGLTLGNDNREPEAARVIGYFARRSDRLPFAARQVRLWCFGFDMKSAKARCWYDSTLPLYVVPPEIVDDLVRVVKSLIDVASEAASLLHKQVKAARFRRPGDVGNEPAVQLGFWQASEAKFYSLLEKVVDADLNDPATLAALFSEWLHAVRGLVLSQFDVWVLAAPIEGMEIKRVVTAQAELGKSLRLGKTARALWKFVNANKKEQP